MLWFTMMLMPAGPSAMKVMVLADVADAEHKDKMIIAKFLAVSSMKCTLKKPGLTTLLDRLRHFAANDIVCYRRPEGMQCCYVKFLQMRTLHVRNMCIS
jgi:hypothetical protein